MKWNDVATNSCMGDDRTRKNLGKEINSEDSACSREREIERNY